MKRTTAVLFALLIMAGITSGCKKQTPSGSGNGDGNMSNDPTVMIDGMTHVEFDIDFSNPGKVITNKLTDMNFFGGYIDWATDVIHGLDEDYFKTRYPFVRTIHFMQATGGNVNRDHISGKINGPASNWVDASGLIKACESVLRQGLKPYIKTGNIPSVMSTNPTDAVFGVNCKPPADYDLYYEYIKEIVVQLKAKFGEEELRTWRWGVFTEFNNFDWFYTDNKSPADSAIAFMKIYDYTVAAIQDVIGQEIEVGAHSLGCADGQWPQEDFIEHCALGINYKTGKKGTRITFLAGSYYEEKPTSVRASGRTLANTINVLREKAESVGLNDLTYGIDEGRILRGNDGKELTTRMVAHTYQASFDARMYKTMVDADIDYFSNWAYSTGAIMEGVDTVALHVANRFYEMVGSKVCSVTKTKDTADSTLTGGVWEYDALASYNEETKKLYVMAYDFDTNYDKSVSSLMQFRIKDADKLGKKLVVKRYIVDDNANFWDEWLDICEKEQYTTTEFDWSFDSASPGSNALSDTVALDFQMNEKNFRENAKLTEDKGVATLSGSDLILNARVGHHGVVFYEIYAQ